MKFLSEDPTNLKNGDPNLYRYVRNKPLIATDPGGEHFERATSEQPGDQILDALSEITRTFDEWEKRNLAQSDRYFHCLMSCRVAKAGPLGKDLASVLGIGREFIQVWKDGVFECVLDMKANQTGLDAASSGQSCERSCYGYKMNRLIMPVAL